ncbi:MAG: FAD-dependent oxidoreductase [Rhodospirillales bacterium]|nr:FAD-dependent oxidoreductase [Rhodospirillales bacterium]
MNTKPKRFDRNLVVIGAGSAGLVSALVAAELGASVTLAEAGTMGGDCLNTGCVPSKALIHAAHLVHAAHQAASMGLLPTPGPADTRAAFAHLRSAIQVVAPHDSAERFRALGVDVRHGHARILSPHEVDIGGDVLTTRAIIVASGAAPSVPDLPGLSDVAPLTSETLWHLEEAPRRLLILGGGPIGSELAQAFARLGSSVTLIQRGPRLLEREEEEASALARSVLERDGVRVLTGHHAVAARIAGGERQMIVRHAGGENILGFDRVLVATGRKARTTGFGLAELGVALRSDGTIATSPWLETSVPGIYACGDVAGPWQFTHAAGHQGWHAAVNALFRPFHRIRPDRAIMPAVTYLAPEIGRAGMSERALREQGTAYEATFHDLAELDRAIADDAREGFVKVLTARGKDRILGVTIAAPRAGEMLGQVVLAMQNGLGLKSLLSLVHAYPTYTEATRDAGGQWRRRHVPGWAPGLMRAFHHWRRG